MKVRIDHARLKELLDYNPQTGSFTWKVHRHRTQPGDVAGSTSKITGYVTIRVCGYLYQAHRLAWFYVHGKWPDAEVDHVNRIRTDNRIGNLRDASSTQNSCNSSMRSDNTSGAKGVFWSKKSKKWHARVGFKSRHYNLGFYKSLDEAKAVVAEARKRIHREFANQG